MAEFTTKLWAESDLDCAAEAANGTGFTQDPLALGSTAQIHLGFHFRDIQIPQGATIKTATLKLYQSKYPTYGNGDVDCQIGFEDVDDSDDFATTADVTTRVASMTTAQTNWTETALPTAYVTTSDFAASVQEIVDRAGWQPGNSATLLLEANDAVAWAGFANPSYGAEEAVYLEITWVEAPRYVRRQDAARGATSNTTAADIGYDTEEIAEDGYGTWTSDAIPVDKDGSYLTIFDLGQVDYASTRAIGTLVPVIDDVQQEQHRASHRYLRNSGGQHGASFGLGVLDLSASEALGVRNPGVLDPTDAVGSYATNLDYGGALQVIRLPASSNITSCRQTVDVASATTDTTGGPRPWVDSTGTWQKTTWNVEDRDDDSLHVASSGDFTLKANKKYMIVWGTTCYAADANRHGYISRLTIDGTHVQTATGVQRDLSHVGPPMSGIYLHEVGGTNETASLYTTQESDGADAGTPYVSDGFFHVVELPDTAEWIHVDNSTTNSLTTALAGTSTWYDTPLSATFRADGNGDLSLDSGNNAVQNDSGKTLPVLAIGWHRWDRNANNVNRKMPWTRWDNGGTPVGYGIAGAYSRGDNGTDDVNNAHYVSAATFDLADGADLAFEVNDPANGTNDNFGIFASTNRHFLGVQVLNLESLAPPIPNVTLAGSAAVAAEAGGNATVDSGAEVAAAGDAPVSSGATGSLSAELPISASAANTSEATGSLSAAVPASGSAAVSSETSGTLSASVPVSGATASATEATGVLDSVVPLTGSMATASDVEGDASKSAGLAGSTDTASEASGSLSATVPASGRSPVSSAASGALSASVPVFGSTANASGLEGSTSGSGSISGSAAGSSGLSGALTGSVELSGVANSASGATGSVEGIVPLAGSAPNASGLSSSGLESTRNVSGSSGSSTDAEANLERARILEGSVGVASGATGELEADLGGVASNASGLSGVVELQVGVTGSFANSSSATAEPIYLVSASADSAVNAEAAVSRGRSVSADSPIAAESNASSSRSRVGSGSAGASSSASGTAGVGSSVSGSSDVSSATSGLAGRSRPAVGSTDSSEGVTGNLEAAVPLGASASSASSTSATASVLRGLVGEAPAATATSVIAGIGIASAGGTSATASSATASLVRGLSGLVNIPVSAGFRAVALFIGDAWPHPDDPTTVVVDSQSQTVEVSGITQLVSVEELPSQTAENGGITQVGETDEVAQLVEV